jgi:hypothetical protein
MAQLPRVLDLEAQRAAMKEVSFLVGKWAGEARLLRGPAESVVCVLMRNLRSDFNTRSVTPWPNVLISMRFAMSARTLTGAKSA